MKKIINTKIFKLLLFYSSLIFLCRLIPHVPNFTPVFAVIIFSSNFQLNLLKKFFFIISPLILSDIFLGFYVINLWVYLAYIFIILVNQKLNNLSLKNILYKSFSYNLIFYVITNLGVWIGSNFYTKDLNGLLECYILALPFFGNALISTLFFLFIFNKFNKFSFYKNLKRI